MSTFKLIVLQAVMIAFSTVSATITSKISGYSYHLGSCPVVDSQEEFRMDQFLGIWYVLYRTSTRTDCIMIKIEPTNHLDKFKITEISTHLIVGLTNINHKYTYEGELTVPDKKDSARMEIHLPATVIRRASFVVIMTDYDTYGLVFSCQKLAFASRQAAFILSRSPSLDQTYIDEIREHLNGYGINDFSF
ncbi:apolipoprotein D-like [Periplaneta americana]|uniref:apolipoprotein D-like n=1 Tax=Periplaneta americana TaxID=6978 RepID=UPI0037E8CC4E